MQTALQVRAPTRAGAALPRAVLRSTATCLGTEGDRREPLRSQTVAGVPSRSLWLLLSLCGSSCLQGASGVFSLLLGWQSQDAGVTPLVEQVAWSVLP